jgi:[protein-PII] uridylyltransferase
MTLILVMSKPLLVSKRDRPLVRRQALLGAGELQRERLARRFKQHPLRGIGQDELDAHFTGMPTRYWERVSHGELVWGLEAIHNFFDQLAVVNGPATHPVIQWSHVPERGFTKVLVCTWDRLGLLAKVAACFTAVRLNIVRAEAYTRADDVVLDVFWVCDREDHYVRDTAALEQMGFLLEGALSEPPRFASLWACQSHKYLARPAGCPPRIQFDNERAWEYTVLRIEAADRLGLLYDILQALADSGVDVIQALVDTTDGIANDTFFLTDADGKKINGAFRLQAIREAVREALESS